MNAKLLAAALIFSGIAGTADAAWIQVSFTGLPSSATVANNSVFGPIVSVSGSFVYDTEAPGVVFNPPLNTKYNYASAIKSFEFTLHTSSGNDVSGSLPNGGGYVQISDLAGADIFQLANAYFFPSQLTGEASYINNAQVNVLFNGPNSLWNSPASLPDTFNPAAFTGQTQFSIFASTTSQRPAGTYVSINFNLDKSSIETKVVPIPPALPLLATAVAGLGLAGWRRARG